jgi:hypothetical protein
MSNEDARESLPEATREALSESERSARSLVDSIPGLVALMTADGHCNSSIVRSSTTPGGRWRR